MISESEMERMKREHWMHGKDELLQIVYEQTSQIATLRAICIKERMRDNYSCIKIDNPFRHHKEKLTPNEAKDQLAKEYPDIKWEE